MPEPKSTKGVPNAAEDVVMVDNSNQNNGVDPANRRQLDEPPLEQARNLLRFQDLEAQRKALEIEIKEMSDVLDGVNCHFLLRCLLISIAICPNGWAERLVHCLMQDESWRY